MSYRPDDWVEHRTGGGKLFLKSNVTLDTGVWIEVKVDKQLLQVNLLPLFTQWQEIQAERLERHP